MRSFGCALFYFIKHLEGHKRSIDVKSSELTKDKFIEELEKNGFTDDQENISRTMSGFVIDGDDMTYVLDENTYYAAFGYVNSIIFWAVGEPNLTGSCPFARYTALIDPNTDKILSSICKYRNMITLKNN